MHPLIATQRSNICRRYQVRRLEVFGSAACGTDVDPERSDADFIVELAPEFRPIWAAGSASEPSWSGCSGVPDPESSNTGSAGSSPQARGTGDRAAPDDAVDRFIPAGAGNGCRSRSRSAARAVHPRRRGERWICSARSAAICGSSPQARGTAARTGAGRLSLRFIPVGAGNGWGLRACRSDGSVHPRKRGERAQGADRPHRGGRFIPAGAGNGIFLGIRGRTLQVHPRRRGERASTQHEATILDGSSPQARGTGHRLPTQPRG